MLQWLASSAAVSLLAALLACDASSQPKQARFVVGPCEPLPVSGIADTRWRTSPIPLIEPGPEGSWDSVDALNPSVVRFEDHYLNLYSGFDGKTWSTGLATSIDGLAWKKHAANPVIRPQQPWEGAYIAANGATLARGGNLLHWYQAGPRNQTRIAFAHSADGVDWERWTEPVLDYGPSGSWDESGLGDPYALACEEWIYLYYLGQNRHGVQRLGVARSRDGVRWQKSHLNPLLEPGGPGEIDERGLGEPAVFFADGSFWMVYVGRDAGEKRRLAWARSEDGVQWRKTSRPGAIEGDQPWNEAVVCDPEIVVNQGRLLILFGGGDRPSPDENLHGRIGVLTPEPSE